MKENMVHFQEKIAEMQRKLNKINENIEEIKNERKTMEINKKSNKNNDFLKNNIKKKNYLKNNQSINFFNKQNVINSDVGYFNKKIALKESRKKNNKKKEQIPETKKEYFICPDFLKIGTNSSSNFDSLLTDMQKKFPENDKTNTVLIMEKILDIKDEDYNEKNCDIFFTEEELENENKNPRREPNILMLEMMKEANLKNI